MDDRKEEQQQRMAKREDAEENPEGKDHIGAPAAGDQDQKTSSSVSSPSQEFSFTISLQSPRGDRPEVSSSSAPFEIDLSPADDIFFHGHLLPLQLTTRSSLISPRSSSTSFSDLNRLSPQNLHSQDLPRTNANSCSSGRDHATGADDRCCDPTKRGSKHNSFTFSKIGKWRKAFVAGEKWPEEEEKKKKVGFDVSRMLKKYARAVRPFLFFSSGSGGRKQKRERSREQRHSFSGAINSRWKDWGGGKLGVLSAPGSMRTSPMNSGLLVAKAAISSSADSTMEELQSAIQAAISHCKSSIAAAGKEEPSKCE